LRIPAHPIAQALLEALGQPLMSSTLILPGQDMPETDVYDIQERIRHEVDLVIDGGHCGLEPTTVIDMVDTPRIVRQGCGVVEGLSE
jgi:tRNA A37 threonylcarbamoyladenosine synthetase subunit TsaC/SUA5/YrdC